MCSDGTSIPSLNLWLEYTVKYTEPFVHHLPKELDEYQVEDWTDYKTLKRLETGLAKQVIARYTKFSQNNYQWIWPILSIALIFVLRNNFNCDLLLLQNMPKRQTKKP